jgi:hypothetical protein
MRASEPKPHWSNRSLVSFDSEVRKRGCGKNGANFGIRTPGAAHVTGARCAAMSLMRRAASIDPQLPALRPAGIRNDAARCLSILLRLRELRRAAEAAARRLLRVLLLRLGAMSAGAGGELL